MLKYFHSMWLLEITAKISFSYFWLMRKCFEGNIKTVLDLGCGDGRFLNYIFAGNVPKLDFTGVDLYENYLEVAKKTKIYKKLVKQDLTKTVWKEIDKKKYDLVFCSQVIEHFDTKKGKNLLKKIENLAKKRIVVATPNGFNSFDRFEETNMGEYESELQKHKSGWQAKDFTSRGYKVYGQGLKFVYKEGSFVRDLPEFARQIFFIISFLSSPLIYFLPQISYNLIAVKEK